MIAAAKEGIVPLPDYDIFKIPSLVTVKDFFMLIFSKSQLESDCIIMALIYCERLVRETKGNFDLQRVNALELAMLEALKYVIRAHVSQHNVRSPKAAALHPPRVAEAKIDHK
eukprot:gene26024-34626_t